MSQIITELAGKGVLVAALAYAVRYIAAAYREANAELISTLKGAISKNTSVIESNTEVLRDVRERLTPGKILPLHQTHEPHH